MTISQATFGTSPGAPAMTQIPALLIGRLRPLKGTDHEPIYWSSLPRSPLMPEIVADPLSLTRHRLFQARDLGYQPLGPDLFRLACKLSCGLSNE